MDDLKKWLDDNDVSVASFAQRLGVKRNYVYAWLNGKKKPRKYIIAITEITQGQVTANSFVY